MDHSTRQTLPQRDQSCLETVTRQKRRPAKMEPWSRKTPPADSRPNSSSACAAILGVHLRGVSLHALR